jgi:hypothetical protein
MSNIIPFDSGNVPAHIRNAFGDTSANTDLSSGVVSGGYAVISYKGNRWHVVEGGNRTLLTNEDGDPRSSIEVVILKSNPHLSKIYYDGGYEEGSTAKPTCYSNDGHGPASDATSPQAAKCAVCKHNAWGSRITENGSKGKACADLRRVAVAPSGDLTKPMLLRIPAASLKELSQYADMLNKRKAPYSAVVTKIGFDPEVAYQRMKFRAVRWLDAEELEAVADTAKLDVINRITGIEADIHVDNGVDELPPPPKHVAKPQPKAVEPEPEFEEERPKPAAKKPDVKKIIDDVDASLDDVLGMLDD